MKIAILGGGMGGLAAAWHLSHHPNAAQFDITVYQRGWRLGGKGASGRNAAFGDRIEEHGLHILLGFYDNALGVLRQCYDEIAALPPATQRGVLPWAQALTPWDEAVLAEPPTGGGSWDFWKATFPTNGEVPGVTSGVPSVGTLVVRAVEFVMQFAGQLGQQVGGALDPALKAAALVIDTLLAALGSGQYPKTLGFLADAIEGLLIAAWGLVDKMVSGSATVRRLWISLYVSGVNVIGMVRDDIVYPPHDFDALDTWDYKAWLKHHAAKINSPDAYCSESPPVNAIYDLAFARATGFAAGTVLYDSLLTFLNYRGHLAYKMNAGMGDIVFAPLYVALAERKVKFKFFHRVTALRLDAARKHVDRIELERQVATVKADYDPLRAVGGIPCWPSEPVAPLLDPKYKAVVGPAAPPALLEQDVASPFAPANPGITLTKGTDFDVVVLAIPVGGLGACCGDLIAANKDFADMVANVKTVGTQALQLWFDRTPPQLGWPLGATMVISYARPFNSWVDMTHLLAREPWQKGKPLQIAYLCDALNAGETTDVRQHAIDWLNTQAAGLWPLAVSNGAFDWSVLHDQAGGVGVQRLDAQYWRANVDGSERYVLSVPGSSAYRLAPDDSGFANLALAGDWVRTDLNAGCLEAATMGGLGAGRAISGGKIVP